MLNNNYSIHYKPSTCTTNIEPQMTMQCIYYLLYIIVIGSVIDAYKVE